MDQLNLNPAKDSATVGRKEEANRKFEAQKTKYDKLRADVAIKLKFLDENRVSVYRK